MYLQRLEKQGLVEGNSGFVGEKELGEKFKGEWHNKFQHQASDLKGSNNKGKTVIALRNVYSQD